MSDFLNLKFPPPCEQWATQPKGFQPGDGIAEFNHDESAQSIPQRFASVGGLYGESIAVAAPNHDAVTHASLLGQMAKMVADLNKLGIGRGDRVALALPDGLQMAMGFLGLSAGATCAPAISRWPRSSA